MRTPSWPQTQPQECPGVSRALTQPGVGSKDALDVAQPSAKKSLEVAALSAPCYVLCVEMACV